MKVLHNICNIVTRALPDMSTLSLWACGPRVRVYISGRALVPVLQLLNKYLSLSTIVLNSRD